MIIYQIYGTRLSNERNEFNSSSVLILTTTSLLNINTLDLLKIILKEFDKRSLSALKGLSNLYPFLSKLDIDANDPDYGAMYDFNIIRLPLQNDKPLYPNISFENNEGFSIPKQYSVFSSNSIRDLLYFIEYQENYKTINNVFVKKGLNQPQITDKIMGYYRKL